MKEQGTTVVFRRWADRHGGDVIALFPEIPHDHTAAGCMSYQHVGQHGGASLGLVGAHTTLATPEEYAPLQRELEGIGYRLKIRKRCTQAHQRTLYDAARASR